MIINPIPFNRFAASSFDTIEYTEAVQQHTLLQNQHRQIVLVSLQIGICLFRQIALQDGFIQIVEGHGRLVLEGQRILLEPGMLIKLPVNTLYSIHAVGNLTFLKVVGQYSDSELRHPIHESASIVATTSPI